MLKSFTGSMHWSRRRWNRIRFTGHRCFLQSSARPDQVLFFGGSGCGFVRNDWNKAPFSWPQAGEGAGLELTQAELNLLLGGLDLSRTRKRRWIR